MTNNTGGAAVAAAMAMLLAGCATAPAAKSTAAMSADATVHCGGINACKGQGSCAGADNACKAQNACKGQGFIELSEKECAAQGGKVVAAKM